MTKTMLLLLLCAPACALIAVPPMLRRSAPTVRRESRCFSHGADDPSLGVRQSAAPLTHEEVERYSRHLILEEVGVEGQQKLKNARVLCIGAGGLGSPALMYLAAAGVGTLTIVDDDVVDYSNLQRQIVHDTDRVGDSKAESARDALRRINPHVTVETLQKRLDASNALELALAHDVILDGSDNFETKFVLDDAAREAGVPLVYAAILRFEGQASVFNYPPGVGPSYRDVLDGLPAAGSVPSCAEGGVLGVLPGVLGCVQATETLKILLGAPPVDTLAGRLLLYDALKMRFREKPIRKGSGDALFSRDEDDAAQAVTPPPAQQKSETPPVAVTLSASECAARLGEGWAPFVLDVRLPQEAEICQLPFADALCPHRSVASIADSLPTDRDILVHCKGGFRSKIACETLAELGHAGRLFDLKGGILAWATEVDPRMAKY